MVDQSSRNKPSDNSDLEQYGIWVKSEPQDIIEEPEDVFSSAGLDDVTLSEPDSIQDSGISGDFSEELESLDVQLEDDSIIDIPLEALSDEPVQQVKQAEVTNSGSKSNTAMNSASIDEISLDDFLDETTDTDQKASMDQIESVNLDEFAADVAVPETDEKVEPELEEIDSIDLDLQFDDTIETPLDTIEEDIFSSDDIEGMDLLDTSASESMDISDFETTETQAEDTNIGGKENVDISAMFIDTEDSSKAEKQKISKQPATTNVPERSTNLDSFIDNEDSMPLQQLSIEELGTDSMEPAAKRQGSSDISINLLNQIASELSTIKNELASLKSQLQAGQAKASNEPLTASSQTDESKGFFEEEDDETIALTGDELENILNTASFTVEASETSEGQESAATDNLQTEILPEDGDYSEQKGIELVDGSAEELDMTLLDESSSLNAEDIVDTITPITKLDADEIELADNAELGRPVALSERSEQFELEELQEIPLEEPDLSGLDLPSTMEELETTLDDSSVDQQISFSHPDENVMDRIVLSIDGTEEKEPTIETSSIPEVEELSEVQEEPIQLLEEIELDVSEEEKLGSRHPDEITTQLDDSLFIENKPAVEKNVGHQETQSQKAPDVSVKLKKDIKTVLLYLDQLLAALPEDKIEEFAQSEYYDTYKKLFEELGII